MLQISLNALLISALPLLTWILLGMIVRPEIANVFSLTYPIQFIYMALTVIFGVGANITAKKLRDKNVVMTNLFVGMIIIGVVTAFSCIRIDEYLEWMGMEVEVYRDFSVYCMVSCFLTAIVQMISQKLYYRNEIKKTNLMNTIYGLVNFAMIVGLNMVTNHVVAIVLTLVVDAIVAMVFLLMNHEKWKFRLCLWQNIKNTSFEILDDFGMFVAYGMGYMHSFSYGKEFLDATNFETLTTDAQWDMLNEAVSTAAKVDVTEGKFKYRKLRRGALGLVGILAGTTLIMTLALYWYYKPDLSILAILIGVQFIDMMMSAMNYLRWSYMQIKDNRASHNVVVLATRVIRVACAFIPTGFCVYIGQLASTLVKYVYARWVCRKFKVFQKVRRRGCLQGR